MNLAERAVWAEHYRGLILARSCQLSQLYSEMGVTPEDLTVDQHSGVINESYLRNIDRSVYSGGMTWLEAADLTVKAMDEIIKDGDNNG